MRSSTGARVAAAGVGGRAGGQGGAASRRPRPCQAGRAPPRPAARLPSAPSSLSAARRRPAAALAMGAQDRPQCHFDIEINREPGERGGPLCGPGSGWKWTRRSRSRSRAGAGRGGLGRPELRSRRGHEPASCPPLSLGSLPENVLAPGDVAGEERLKGLCGFCSPGIAPRLRPRCLVFFFFFLEVQCAAIH